MNTKIMSELKEKLEKEKESLEKELSAFADKPARRSLGEGGGDKKPKDDWDTRYPKFEGNSPEDEADELQEYEKLLSVEYSLELKLRDVNSALEKINKNKYGKCEKCGKEISPERLEACPEAKFCTSCN